ncbi:MAG: hypothetical protein ACT4QC_17975 [Planctomycetaceae bacterium]
MQPTTGASPTLAESINKCLKDHLLVVIGTIFIAGWFFREGVIRFFDQEIVSASEIKEGRAACDQIEGWDMTEPLYKTMACDTDFLVRGVDIAREVGRSVRVVGPKLGDDFTLNVSNYAPTASGGHSISFDLAGILDSNVFRPSVNVPEIMVQRQAKAGPFQAGVHQFFVYIDDVRLDQLTVSVSRRKMTTTNTRIKNSVVELNTFRFPDEPLPEPVLRQK